MRIAVADVLDLVLGSLPDPPDVEDAGELPYGDAGTVAHHVVELARTGRLGELVPFFDVVERLHAEGDQAVSRLATIGYLEGVQNVALHRGLDPAVFVPLLGPETARWWRGLDAFWAGQSRGGVRPVD